MRVYMEIKAIISLLLILGIASASGYNGNLTLNISHGSTLDLTTNGSVVNGSWFFIFNFTPSAGTVYNFSYSIDGVWRVFPNTGTLYHPFGAYAQGGTSSGGDNNYTQSIGSSVSGADVTISLNRSGMANISTTFTIPLPNSTTYYPNTTYTLGGTNTTSNITLMWYYDGLTYNISEGSGTPPVLDLYINYTNVTTFSQWIVREYYLGLPTHSLVFEIYDYPTGTWESYYSIVGQGGFTIITVPVYDPTDHINTTLGGRVQTRIRHTGEGENSHRLQVDFAWLISGNNIGASTNLAGYVKANGTPTYIPFFSGSASLGDTTWFYNTTTNRTGINITSPTAPLEVNRYNATNKCAIQVDSLGTYCARESGTAYAGLYSTLKCADRESPLITVNAMFKGGLWVSSTNTTRTSYNLLQQDLTGIMERRPAACTYPAWDETENAMTYADDQIYCQFMNFELPWDYKNNGAVYTILNWISNERVATDVRWYYDVRCLKRCAELPNWETDGLEPKCVDVRPPYLETSLGRYVIQDVSATCRDMAAGDKVQIKLWRDNGDISTENALGLIFGLVYEQKDIGDANIIGRT
jgi:hypothetical protein